jgi:DNA-binding XRE family transcriptional regulator
MDGTISLKKLRLKAGKTQKDMGELCDVSLNTWRSWEKDPRIMPHGMWLDAVAYLETAIQAKETSMAQHFECKKAIIGDEAYKDEDEWTVPIPEGLTDTFEPSKPCTKEQLIRYSTGGPEPYPGYEKELEAWEDAWEDVRQRQAEADGDTYLTLPNVITGVPEDVDEDGNLIQYDEPQVVVDAQSGDATLAVPDGDAKEADEAVKEADEADSDDGVDYDWGDYLMWKDTLDDDEYAEQSMDEMLHPEDYPGLDEATDAILKKKLDNAPSDKDGSED